MQKNNNVSEKKRLISNKSEIGYWVVFALLLVLILFLGTYKLDTKYVDTWDEARHGVNAYEMLKEGNLFQNTYLYEPDYYNLKPPFSMWGIMLMFQLLGPSVFSLRIFSVLCYVATAAIVGLFARKYGKLESLFTLMFLAVNTLSFEFHMIRSGDADSLYCLFFSLAMICMLKISEKQWYLYLCGLFFSCAFLTKSYHAAVIVVIGGLFLLVTGELKKMKLLTWIKFFLSFAIPTLGWCIARYLVDGKEFFYRMIYTDIIKRTGGDSIGTEEGFFYYVDWLLGAKFGKITIYLWAVVICLVGCLLFHYVFSKLHYKKIIGYMLWIMIPFVAFSAVSSRRLWYVYPVLIPLLMCAGVLSARILKWKELQKAGKMIVFVSFLLFFAFYVNRELDMIENQKGNEFQLFVQQIARAQQDDEMSAYVELQVQDTLKTEEEKVAAHTWAQQDVFIAEVYGDYLCKQGGLDEFLQKTGEDKDSVLFMSKEVYENSKELVSECIVVGTCDNYVAVKNK